MNKNKRLFASTIQTFQDCYQDFSPGDFDVIISDESHRSIYNKWRDVFTYFDAIEIGLTATPAELIERNTYRFFECDEGGNPTALYTYEKPSNDTNGLHPSRFTRHRLTSRLKESNPKMSRMRS